ncbi:MAG: type II toxin-antitoxin system PemK/MazF family toxin [Proteobacteria bacterium]|nr:type II toxin-antitoxin system PemK/MazF family toxin [Pseudomonadota bacterium]
MVARSAWVPARRDMIWINCNPQAGREMRDVHPLLVLSPREFNERTGIVIGLPMTTASYNDTNPFAIRFAGPKGASSYILAHQPKSFDWRARAAKPHPWRQVTQETLDLACETLNQIIDIAT